MKKIFLTLEDIFNLPETEIVNPDSYKSITNVSIDSRNIKKNSLFVAIKGEKFDGHNFINDVVRKGCSAVVINKSYLKKLAELKITVITVPDTTKTLGDIANVWRKKLGAKVIGITGSAGKTTTKDMLTVLLSKKYSVNKTVANNNNHIGVPLTILSTTSKYQVLVAECGTNHFGEIPYTTKILQPDYSLITMIGNSHLEFLKNKKGVLKEKSALFTETLKNRGIVFLNTDDKLLSEFLVGKEQSVSFGFEGSADVSGKIVEFDVAGRPTIEITYKSKKISVKLPVSGIANAKSFLAASAIALKLGVSKKDFIESIKKINSSSKRASVKTYRSFTLIDDTYNANPDSVRTALSTLQLIQNRKRKVAILGDMFELGEKSIFHHEELSKIINSKSVDEVYTIGKMMKHLSKKLSGKAFVTKHFEKRESLEKFLQKLELNDSAILIKGSRGMQMEDFVKVIHARSK